MATNTNQGANRERSNFPMQRDDVNQQSSQQKQVPRQQQTKIPQGSPGSPGQRGGMPSGGGSR